MLTLPNFANWSCCKDFWMPLTLPRNKLQFPSTLCLSEKKLLRIEFFLPMFDKCTTEIKHTRTKSDLTAKHKSSF